MLLQFSKTSRERHFCLFVRAGVVYMVHHGKSVRILSYKETSCFFKVLQHCLRSHNGRMAAVLKLPSTDFHFKYRNIILWDHTLSTMCLGKIDSSLSCYKTMNSSADLVKVIFLLLIYILHQTYGLLPILFLKVVHSLLSQGTERGALTP